MYTKKSGRVSFRSSKRSNFKRNNNFSNYKSRNKGNVTQQYNKYLKLAKEASSSGDRIQSEFYYQFTDHYYRIMTELGISLEENDVIENKVSESKTADIEEKTSSETAIIQEEKNIDTEESSTDDLESIESIPFISDPPKKKSTKSKKILA